ncbi:Zn(2)-C6 fungal-type DNA-binding domain [Phaffia rhodozyma]|uniref:Zn(2)-C6 fungal-type DNA-binding domain n=1 Tax=Phaffia rhodozyma TaxID=264483 RepID=A0A0F7SW11_PHARH|nr:Zn(2)-C6 fungal-type DNA-binding domain [Phaffia rhodozyma]
MVSPNTSISSPSSSSSAPTARAARSRRDRPCDACRAAKRRCFKFANEPCVACKSSLQACLFENPPNKRPRTVHPTTGPEDLSDKEPTVSYADPDAQKSTPKNSHKHLINSFSPDTNSRPLLSRLSSSSSSVNHLVPDSSSGQDRRRPGRSDDPSALGPPTDNTGPLPPIISQGELEGPGRKSSNGSSLLPSSYYPPPMMTGYITPISHPPTLPVHRKPSLPLPPISSPRSFSESTQRPSKDISYRDIHPVAPSFSHPSAQGPLARILNRVRLGGSDYDHSERTTSEARFEQSSSHISHLSSADSPPLSNDPTGSESALSKPILDSSRLASSEQHFASYQSEDDPSLLALPSDSAPSVAASPADGTSTIRQVAGIRDHPNGKQSRIFFVSRPTLPYPRSRTGKGVLLDGTGRGAKTGSNQSPDGEEVDGGEVHYPDPHFLRALEYLEGSSPGRILDVYIALTLPAMPFINLHRLRNCLTTLPPTAFTYPSRTLTGILASTVMYDPNLRGLYNKIWPELYEGLTAEYLQPRLQTLQLTLIDLTSRPDVNPGGNSISIARAIGAAQLLGLHLDCSDWNLPKWEKCLRKRLWISLYQGRPSHIHPSNCDVPLLNLDDFDPPFNPDTLNVGSPYDAPSTPGSQANSVTFSREAKDSADSFRALCSLSIILDHMLEEFFTVKAQSMLFTNRSSRKANRVTRLRIIESFGGDLDRFERDLPYSLRLARQDEPNFEPATGVKSLQLAYLGLTIVLGRLTADLFDPEDEADREDVARVIESGLDLVENVIFLESQFERSIPLLRRFIATLTTHHQAPGFWDPAERALAKLMSLMPSVSKLVPEVGAIWRVFSDQIWHQMCTSPTSDVLIASIPVPAPSTDTPVPVDNTWASNLETASDGVTLTDNETPQSNQAPFSLGVDPQELPVTDALFSSLPIWSNTSNENSTASTSRPNLTATTARPSKDDIPADHDQAFETIIGEEDLWAGLGNVEGFTWMQLGFEG